MSTRGHSTREAEAPEEYLTLVIAGEEYGLPASCVRETIAATDVTRVPHAPPGVRGVVNVRGKIVPAVELRVKLGFPAEQCSARACVVVELAHPAGPALMGLIVDEVRDVVIIDRERIQQTPDLGGCLATAFATGIATVNGTVRILLDIDRMLGAGGASGRVA